MVKRKTLKKSIHKKREKIKKTKKRTYPKKRTQKKRKTNRKTNRKTKRKTNRKTNRKTKRKTKKTTQRGAAGEGALAEFAGVLEEYDEPGQKPRPAPVLARATADQRADDEDEERPVEYIGLGGIDLGEQEEYDDVPDEESDESTFRVIDGVEYIEGDDGVLIPKSASEPSEKNINDMKWRELSPSKQILAQALGWKDMGEEELMLVGPDPYDDWGDLTDDERKDAKELGYDESEWNKIGWQSKSRYRHGQRILREEAEAEEARKGAELKRTITVKRPEQGAELKRTTTVERPEQEPLDVHIDELKQKYLDYIKEYFNLLDDEGKSERDLQILYNKFIDQYFEYIIEKSIEMRAGVGKPGEGEGLQRSTGKYFDPHTLKKLQREDEGGEEEEGE